jgi:hypothetical protein
MGEGLLLALKLTFRSMSQLSEKTDPKMKSSTTVVEEKTSQEVDSEAASHQQDPSQKESSSEEPATVWMHISGSS